MVDTGADVPPSLVEAFREELDREPPGLDRRRFLRQVAEGAAGPLPERRAQGEDEPPPDALPDAAADGGATVPVEDGVALALAVLVPFDREAPEASQAVDPGPAATTSGSPALSGRTAARELARRLRVRIGRR